MIKIGYITSLIGLGFLITSIYLLVDHRQFMANAREADGEVVRIDIIEDDEGNSYMPVIKFYADGKEVVSRPNVSLSPPYNKSTFSIGQKIHLFYDARDPKKIFLTGFFENWGTMIIFGIVGIIFLPAGLIIIGVIRHKKNLRKWLEARGQKIEADFMTIEINHGTTKNEKNPSIIIANWTDPMTRISYRFLSKDEIWEDPAPFIPTNKKIPVLIDPQKPKNRNWMVLSFLPATALES